MTFLRLLFGFVFASSGWRARTGTEWNSAAFCGLIAMNLYTLFLLFRCESACGDHERSDYRPEAVIRSHLRA